MLAVGVAVVVTDAMVEGGSLFGGCDVVVHEDAQVGTDKFVDAAVGDGADDNAEAGGE